MIKLYKKDATGQIREWRIWYEGSEIVIGHGVFGGQMQEKREPVVIKGNNSLSEQIQSRIASRCGKKRDNGYLADLAAVQRQEKARNALGLFKPMLAHKMKDFKGPEITDWYVQYKYNGHRCLVTNIDGNLFAYSRQGKEIKSIDHILEKIDIPEDMTLDGELYIHGKSLQAISSLIKRKQFGSHELEYKLYDCMLPVSFKSRYDFIYNLLPDMVVPTYHNGPRDTAALKTAIERGYEGLIVRHGASGYEDGKRSKSLLKLKSVDDGEFEVVDIVLSADGWAILVCQTDLGKRFKVSAPGTMEEKFIIVRNYEKYIGQYVTVEWAELTQDKIPFHPIATGWVQDISIG